jgi:formylglycine-generating enzyme required for sulfatase activity
VRKPRRRAGLLAGIAVAVAATLAAASAGWYWSSHEPPEPEPTPITLPPRPGPVVVPAAPVAAKLATFAVDLQLRHAIRAHHFGGVTALLYAPNGRLLITGGRDPNSRLKLCEPDDGKPIRTLPQPTEAPFDLAISHDGRLLAARGQGSAIHLCEATTAKVRPAVAVDAPEARGIALSPDGLKLYWGDRSSDALRSIIRVRDLDAGREFAAIETDAEPLLALAGSASGGSLATGGAGGKLSLYDTGLRLPRWGVSFDGPCPCVAIAPDFPILAAAGPLKRLGTPGMTIRLFGTAKGKPLGTLPIQAPVTALAFSRDGGVLAVACADGTVRLWDWDDQRLLAVRPVHAGPVRAVAFAPDNKTLATGGDDGALKLWDVRTSPRPIDAHATRRIVNSLGMGLLPVPAGELMMGDGTAPPHGPKHAVRIRQPYYLGVHEVTVGQFRSFIRASGYQVEALVQGPSWENAGGEQSEDHPVVAISHADALAFCRWLSKKEGRTYRLPTEAEWEHAARSNRANDGAAGPANDRDLGLGKPVPVGCFGPGVLGFCDLAGNVAEWCADWYAPDYYADSPEDDPPGPPKPAGDPHHLVRGGAFSSAPAACAVWHRQQCAGRLVSVGFRVLMEPTAEDLVPWQPLWSGKDLSGWEVKQGQASDWVLEDGRLRCLEGAKGWIGTKRHYSDFLLRIEWRIEARGDSGVHVRVPSDNVDPKVSGFQVQILDNASIAKLAPTSQCGALIGVAAPLKPRWRGPGEWNIYEIMCRGQHYTVTFNNEVVVDLDGPKRVPPLARAKTGMIGLEAWRFSTEFRNAFVKDRSAATPPKAK